jgi:hypothetical protein
MESEPSRVFLRARVQAIKSAGVKFIVIPEDLRKEILTRFVQGRRWLKPRHLRDVSRLLGLIKAHALLNLWHRERQGDTVIANMEDVEAGFKLYESIAEANELGLAPELLEVYKAIEEDGKEDGYTIAEFQKLYLQVFHKPIGYDKARRMLVNLASAGLLTEDVDSKDKRRVRYFCVGVEVKIHAPSSLCTLHSISENVENGKAQFEADSGKEPQNYLIGGAGKSPLFYSHPSAHISHGEPASDGSVLPIGPGEPAEKCELCGLRAVEWKVYFGGQWLKRCSTCLEKMRALGLKLHYQPLTEGETNNET